LDVPNAVELLSLFSGFGAQVFGKQFGQEHPGPPNFATWDFARARPLSQRIRVDM
jgi:hypothetical protein